MVGPSVSHSNCYGKQEAGRGEVVASLLVSGTGPAVPRGHCWFLFPDSSGIAYDAAL